MPGTTDDSTFVNMLIEAYDEEFQSAKSDLKFSFPINPENYSIKYGSTSAPDAKSEEKKTASGDKIPKNEVLDVRTLSLTFFIDSTVNYKEVALENDFVSNSIKKFNKVCTEVNGDIHTLNYVKVKYGDLDFNCKLESLGIQYLMFRPDGKPVRAKIDASFKEYIDPVTLAKRHGKSSPDMSHLRTVRAGDNLPAMCQEIYGNRSYYLQVAELNGILNFRSLKPGTKILFPSIQK